MALSIEIALLLFGIGVLGGAVSAVAGGASFFSFPALLWVGLPPLEANATNFIALAPGNGAALPAYRRELREIGWSLAGPLLVGAIGGTLGTLLVLWMGGGHFARAVPFLILTATLLFIAAPYVRGHLAGRAEGGWLPAIALFLMSVYCGFFGAGIGQVVLAALMMIGYTRYNEANAAKNALIVAISVISIVIYSVSGLISWPHALVMMAGTSFGGYYGAAVARRLPDGVLRAGVIGFGVFLTAYYFVVGVG